MNKTKGLIHLISFGYEVEIPGTPFLTCNESVLD
jgi:hypothetical protein